MKTCLLLTEQFEPTADLLVAEMRRRGMSCVRWNLDQFPIGSTLTYAASNDSFSTLIDTDGRTIDLDRVGSIWCRGVRALGFPADLADPDRRFAEAESERMLTGFMTIAKARWINHPHSHMLANAKPTQLAIARTVGLDIPPTLISNDPARVREFIAGTKQQTVYKTLTQALHTEPGQALFTSIVTEQAAAKLDLIGTTPGIFQHLVPKAYELRVTVVGLRIFCARIDSQSRAETTIDWRHLPFEVDAAHDLPSEISAKINALMKALGLFYGAFDFIVTPDGRYVFLEVNPAGHYMWIESKLGLPITAALADALSEPCREPG